MTLDEALQRAARDLPDGWLIQVGVERGAAWIELHNPDGDGVNFDSSPDKTLAEQLDDAIVEACSE
jgi:hypothetical protein